MNFKDFLKNNIVYFDGGMGTLLQSVGLKSGESPERWNITKSEVIIDIQKRYFDAGSNVVCTNTFGANCLKFSENELEDIISSAIKNAKKAAEMSISKAEKFVALDIGPSGRLLKPLGDLDFEEAVSVFAKTVELGEKHGADLIMIETMNDSYETKAAVIAAKENSTLPIVVSNAYNEDGKLMTGATPEVMAAMLCSMGVTAIGANCSFGPKQLKSVVERLLNSSTVPVLFKPNAGLPKVTNGKTVYDVLPGEFAEDVTELIKKGVRIAGGCCGTTPEYISALTQKSKGLKPIEIKPNNDTVVTSYSKTVSFGKKPILIGERINPTGKKRFKQALLENDIDYILQEGSKQEECGVDILDVNVGMPGIDEAEMLKKSVYELQSITALPLQIDTANAKAMENALRIYNGKALINSVNGKKESMEAVFPLVKKYGGTVIALTLDEEGIPSTVEGRFKIAKRIIKTAKEYGIDKKDIIFDTLTMAVSADSSAAEVTIRSLKRIKEELGCHTSLGVSNISFGLPNRDIINSTFFASALANGLSAAIMNPYSIEMMKTYRAYCVLSACDENCTDYITFAENLVQTKTEIKQTSEKKADTAKDLENAIIKGFKEKAAELTAELLKSSNAMDIINTQVIPALNKVGVGFEKKTVYLPQLLMSAEAGKSSLECIRRSMKGSDKTENKGKFVIATVKGDIHDIGKNIVKLLLENYGFDVYDLGKDVPAEDIVNTVIEEKAPLLGLSALMTTTLPAMEETIKLAKEKAPWCRIIVGGAVLTEEYAMKIGADKYASDAMETVRFAENSVNS